MVALAFGKQKVGPIREEEITIGKRYCPEELSQVLLRRQGNLAKARGFPKVIATWA
jgi:hypothetical protein